MLRPKEYKSSYLRDHIRSFRIVTDLDLAELRIRRGAAFSTVIDFTGL
jgi:hypothetical protein